MKKILELLVEFDEMGYTPTTVCPDPEGEERRWKAAMLKEIAELLEENEEVRERKSKVEEDRESKRKNSGSDRLAIIKDARAADTHEQTIEYWGRRFADKLVKQGLTAENYVEFLPRGTEVKLWYKYEDEIIVQTIEPDDKGMYLWTWVLEHEIKYKE